MANIALIFALLFEGFFLGLTGLERRLFYPLDPTRIAPVEIGLTDIREVRMQSGSVTLVIWVATPRPGRPTVLYFHGNGGNLANRARRFEKITARGYGLVAPAYRGSSGSGGRPNEARLTRDAQDVWSRLDNFVPGLEPKNVVIYGESLGSAVALKLLAQPGVVPPAGVVLDAPFTSLPEVALHHAPEHAALIAKLTNIWDNRTHAKTLMAPLLVLHGTRDQVVPFEQGREVFDAAGSAQKSFIAVDGADHSGTWADRTEPRLWRFIDRL